MPTLYPKCPPGEVLGFLVVLNTHRGSQEIARLAEEENLPIDKILPAVEYAQGLGLVTIDDGRATLTDSGRMLLAAGIRVRKVLLREILKRTILFRAIQRSLEQSVDGTVAEDELAQIVAFTTAPPEAIQDIVNWGRYTELFRYDANRRAILPIGTRGPSKVSAPIPLPAAPARPPTPPSKARTPPREGIAAPAKVPPKGGSGTSKPGSSAPSNRVAPPSRPASAAAPASRPSATSSSNGSVPESGKKKAAPPP